jgi:hypothetical protein
MARGINVSRYSASGAVELLIGTDFSSTANALRISEDDVKKAANKAARKAAQWATKEGSAALSGITTIPRRELMEAVRFRMRPMRGGGGSAAWFGLNDVSAKHEGAQQTESGVSTRVANYPSAFVVHKLGGHVFKRRGAARLPIDKVTHSVVNQMEAALSAISARAEPIYLDAFFAELDKVLGRGSGAASRILLSQ